MNETIPIISGTDSQYERIDIEELPERQNQKELPRDASIRNQNQGPFLNNYTPEESPEGQRTLWPEDHPNHPEEYRSFTLLKPEHNIRR